MNNNRFFLLAAALCFGVVLAFSGCKPDDDDENAGFPVDQDPQVALVSHPNGYVLSEVGDVVTIEFEFFDNELLTSYRLNEVRTSVMGQMVYEADLLQPSNVETLSSRRELRSWTYTVPNVQVYTTIDVTAIITDNKGKVATATLAINVIPTPGSGPLYEIQEYPLGDTIWALSSGHDFYFDLINRKNGNGAQIPSLQRDLYEISSTGFTATLSSPNTNGADSVMVHTNTGAFNFDEMTYTTTYQAFVTSNRVGRTAGPLAVNDVVILKMANAPHFAAIKVNQLGPDYIVFSYKYSHN